ncbi:MAG: hypothetical protein ACREHD_04015, partial [Pirellulales bacterium]
LGEVSFFDGETYSVVVALDRIFDVRPLISVTWFVAVCLGGAAAWTTPHATEWISRRGDSARSPEGRCDALAGSERVRL